MILLLQSIAQDAYDLTDIDNSTKSTDFTVRDELNSEQLEVNDGFQLKSDAEKRNFVNHKGHVSSHTFEKNVRVGNNNKFDIPCQNFYNPLGDDEIEKESDAQDFDPA